MSETPNDTDRDTLPAPPPTEPPCQHAIAIDGVCRDCGEPVKHHARPWLDYGKDTGPRLRVKGFVDPPKPPPLPDDGTNWRETHKKLKTALAEHDQTTIGKVMEPMFDQLHSDKPQTPSIPPFDREAFDLSFRAELSEWAKANKFRRNAIGFHRFLDGSVAVRMFPEGEDAFEVRIDKRSQVTAWHENFGLARLAAERVVRRMAGELAAARHRETLAVPDTVRPH